MYIFYLNKLTFLQLDYLVRITKAENNFDSYSAIWNLYQFYKYTNKKTLFIFYCYIVIFQIAHNA